MPLITYPHDRAQVEADLERIDRERRMIADAHKATGKTVSNKLHADTVAVLEKLASELKDIADSHREAQAGVLKLHRLVENRIAEWQREGLL